MTHLRQLPLDVGLRDEATFDNFVAFDDFAEKAWSVLRHLCEQPGFQAVYLAGATGSGRSHLLQAVCHQVEASGLSAIYAPVDSAEWNSDPTSVEALESFDVVAIDNVDTIAGSIDWEQALLTLYDRCHEAEHRLVFSAGAPPVHGGFALADLSSRLCAAMQLRLNRASDEQKCRIIRTRAGSRGFSLSPEAAYYILSRAPRDLGSLMDLIDHLDRTSLAAKRGVTVPFIRDALANLEDAEQATSPSAPPQTD